MTPGWPENFIRIRENGLFLLKLQYYSSVFAKVVQKYRNSNIALFVAVGFLKTKRKFDFFNRTVEHFSDSKLDPSRPFSPPPPPSPKAKTWRPGQEKCTNPQYGQELTDIESTKSIIKIKVEKILQFPEWITAIA